MQKIAIAFIALLFLVTPLYSQVTNFMVNGSSTNFSMTSGDVVNWSFNLPAGATATGEIWIDLNANHLIDPGTDRQLFNFGETDGDTVGYDGPPDMDGIVNGAISISIPVGLAPQNYVMRFSHNGVGQQVWGVVAPLASPAYTISGTVTGPVGFDLRYLVVELSSENGATEAFWHGLTDSTGAYTIETDSDTAGNPWRLRVNDPPQPYSVQPDQIPLTFTGSLSGQNFTILAAAAQVVGQLRDDAGDTLALHRVYISRNDMSSSNPYHEAQTDEQGHFRLGIPLSELNGNTWQLSESYDENQPVTTHMPGRMSLPVIFEGDSLVRTLISYTVNSTIDGFVQLNGANPGFSILMMATNQDTGESYAWSDPANGHFTIPVTDKIADYQIAARNYFDGYTQPFIVAHPGDGGITFNLQTTGVDDAGAGLPSGFALGQNYPNPFNPVTAIPYAIPTRAQVVLTVYDVLGRVVAVLVNEVQEPGKKIVSFDAANLPSGVYSYRISSGTFSQARRMLVLK